jgi:hypothetical protein
MPELADLLAEAAVRQQPDQQPPFTRIVLRARQRRRQQVRSLVALAVVGASAVTLGVPVLGRGASSTSEHVAQDPSPLPVANRTCRPTELVLALTWVKTSSGSLRGSLTATNPNHEACLLLVKPHVTPVGVDGQPLRTEATESKEGRWGPDALIPGATAQAPVVWTDWCGEPAGQAADVTWSGEERLSAVRISTTGPAQPACLNHPASTVSSSWFEGLSASVPGPPVEVAGTLLATGGPAGAPPQGVPGTIVLQADDEVGTRTTAIAIANGTFHASVTPGWYSVRGTSPMYNDGQGTCLVTGRLHVPVEGRSDIEVICARK